jgi:single-stranded-DNA-specific exonuclease
MSGEGLINSDQQEILKSVRNNKWVQRPYDRHFVESLRQQVSAPDVVLQLLSKSIKSPSDAKNYLDPKLKNLLPDPFSLKDMRLAVNTLIRAIDNKSKIVIFGDYDVDGATSSAVLKKIFESLRCDIGIYIPDRVKEGYGPNKEAINRLHEQGYRMMITVDCGSSSHEEILLAKELNMNVVILDHHKCSGDLPKADALVNPNREDDDTEYGYLAAVGVSFLFALALCSELKSRGLETKNVNLLELLDLVALGTVCDVVPLVGLNRAFVKQGLKVMKSRSNIGLNALQDVASVSGDITVYHLGFVIGPRINAGGRVGESSLGADLLTSHNYEESVSISTSLDMYNSERKSIEASVLEEAKEQASNSSVNDPLILVSGKGWHQGVIGIVAGRLKEFYRKPTAVISIGSGEGKASCRSVEGIDFGAAVIDAKSRGLLEAGGGHAMAAGFSILESKIEEFREFLSSRFQEKYNSIRENAVSYYASILSVNSIKTSFIKGIESVGPFGSGNAQPKFMIKNVFIMYPKILKDSHISCLVVAGKNSYTKGGVRAIAFSVMQNAMGELLLSQKENMHLIVTLDINKWQDKENPQLIIQDVIMGDEQ